MPAYADPNGGVPPPVNGLPADLRDYYLNFGDPLAGFYHYLGQNRQGTGGGQYNLSSGQDNFSRFAQDQMPRYEGMWHAAAADNPGIGFYDFLNQQDVGRDYQNQTDQQKGLFSSVVTPRGRMILR